MATNVVMPQMGESIAEGTIVRWIKKVGDNVDRDEPLFEISTDKVDAEIPSPGAGVLTEIKVKEGETVPVNSVVAVIGAAGEQAAPRPPSRRRAARVSRLKCPRLQSGSRKLLRRLEAAAAASAGSPPRRAWQRPPARRSKDDLRRQKSSPLVRRIAREHNVDISSINGTGISGRVTKHDILGFIESGKGAPAGGGPPSRGGAPGGAGRRTFRRSRPGDKVEIVPMSIMRKKIAEHMVISARTSPHVYSVYEVDFHRLAKLREKHKAEYERSGAKLTFTALIAKVVVDALRAFPVVNASIDGDNIVYKKDINLGIAVALDQGLIVPVIRNADEKNLVGLSRAIDDLATRARAEETESRRSPGGHVHHHQSRDLRRRLRAAAHQPAAGRDPRRRRRSRSGPSS